MKDCSVGSAALQEPDLILTVAVSRVGVAGHDERVVDAHTWGVQQLSHGVDLTDDGYFISGAGKPPRVYSGGRPDLDDDLVVVRLWRLGLMFNRKVVRHSDILGDH